MRIAFVNQPWNTIDPPVESPDSIAILIYEMARRLSDSCEVIIYARKGPSQAAVASHEGINYRRISIGFDYLLKPLHLLDRFRLCNPKRPVCSWALYYLGYALQVAMDLRKNKCDIVHIFTFSNFVPIIRMYNPEIKIVLHMEDHSLTQRDRKMINSRLEQTDMVIGCSNFIAENIRKRYPNIGDRCHTLYNGVDVDRFSSNSEPKSVKTDKPKKLLFVGRLSPEKGLHVLLEALKKILIRFPEVELEIAGPFLVVNKFFIDPLDEDTYLANLDSYYRNDTSYHEFLKKILPSKFRDSISFLGAVSHLELANNYRKADIFVIPSLWNEPFGIPLVEAMSTGLPVVATRGGAFPEIVEEGKTGYLVKRGDVDSLAESILKLISNEDLCDSMGKAARQRTVKLFSWDPTVERLKNLYERINNRVDR